MGVFTAPGVEGALFTFAEGGVYRTLRPGSGFTGVKYLGVHKGGGGRIKPGSSLAGVKYFRCPQGGWSGLDIGLQMINISALPRGGGRRDRM